MAQTVRDRHPIVQRAGNRVRRARYGRTAPDLLVRLLLGLFPFVETVGDDEAALAAFPRVPKSRRPAPRSPFAEAEGSRCCRPLGHAARS
jgi:hypothetical protein